MNFSDILRTAVFALRGNWMRSALTSLGVIIGIAAVIVMVSVGQGTQAEIDKMVAGTAARKLDISPGWGRRMGGVRMSRSSYYTLTTGDLAAIRNEIPEVQYISGSLNGNSQVVYAENNWPTSWRGIQPDYMMINDWVVARGRGIQDEDNTASNKVVVLGETVRRELFGDDSGVGQTLRVGRVPFEVIGTLAPRGRSNWGSDQDDVIMVPLETARRRLMGSMGLPPNALGEINLAVADERNLSFVQGEVEGLLRQRHDIQPGAQDDFEVRNIAEMVATRTATTRLMSLLLGAVATISLIVGGIGIMNIMLVSVTERIREIGLRMAVGAGPGDVQRQFLAEAMLISVIGGVLGILIGIVGALLVGRFGALPVALNGQVIGLAAGFSVATGLFFGFYPARKASQLDPIEALRQQ